MASPLKKQRNEEETKSLAVKLPEHLIFSRILPLLSFKTLCRFKSVAKTWHRLISDDWSFALDQSHHVSPISSGIVFAGCHGDNLTFLPTFGSPIGAPHLPRRCRRILASANGLLCLYCCRCSEPLYGERPYLYVCNPATKDGHFITEHDKSIDSVGLAFDPVTSPNHYKLVHPIRRYMFMNGSCTLEYRFEVFSSSTNKWVGSNQKVEGITCRWRDEKSVFVSGVVYWDCNEYLLAFDPEKDLAGCIPLPEHPQPFTQEIGVCDGRVTCTRLDSKSIQVWIMSADREGWESKYLVSMEDAMEVNRDMFSCFCCVMKRRRACQSPSEILFYGHGVWPLPFGGGERLYLWISPRRRKKKGKEKAVVVSYDLKTGKVEKLCVVQPEVGNYFTDKTMFLYHNSMVRLPKLPR